MLGEHYAVSEIALLSTNKAQSYPQCTLWDTKVTKLGYAAHVLADLLNRAASMQMALFGDAESELHLDPVQYQILLHPFFVDCEEAAARMKRCGLLDNPLIGAPIKAVTGDVQEDPATKERFIDWPDLGDVGPPLKFEEETVTAPRSVPSTNLRT